MQASVHEAKTNLSRLLAAVERGERVIITRNGIPAAELIPARPGKVRLGSLRSLVAPPPDAFLAPLGENDLAAWEGE
jgi:prevent-host-death family protein